jgi:cell wall-associated NlpC family hydrolase
MLFLSLALGLGLSPMPTQTLLPSTKSTQSSPYFMKSENQLKSSIRGSMNLAKIKTEMAINYARQFIGVPYKWGGNNPMEGFDCSGFIQWVLHSVGLLNADRAAYELYGYFIRNGQVLEKPEPGAILFYGEAMTAISHIALAVNDIQIIEAGGGGRSTLTLDDCKKSGACVRERLYDYRKDLLAIVMPNYEKL